MSSAVPPTYTDYLEADSVGAPAVLKTEARIDLGDAPLAASRYVSSEFFALEVERLWPRVWQMVCREEDLPCVGDALPYDIVGRSFIIVRVASDRIRAFYNSCPHRGRKLLLAPAQLTDIRCPFHGFGWNLEGEIERLPCRWDFAHVPAEDLRLQEARIASWGGFVFLNMDAHAPSLEEYLGVLPSHFSRWPLEQRYKAVHVGKVIGCNWKVAQEAFMESYHVIATHPQILHFCADANARYDILGPHVNRNLTAFAAPSPHLGARASPARTLEGMLGLLRRAPLDAQDGEPRAIVAQRVRESFARTYGGDWSGASDAELLDAIVYNVFPNFSPWGGLAPNIVYRWRPNGLDVDS